MEAHGNLLARKQAVRLRDHCYRVGPDERIQLVVPSFSFIRTQKFHVIKFRFFGSSLFDIGHGIATQEFKMNDVVKESSVD